MFALSDSFSLTILLKIAQVSKSGYYKWLKNRNNKKEDSVTELIKKIFYDHKKTFGIRQIKLELQNKYHLTVNKKRIQRIMRQNNLVCKIRQKRKDLNNIKEQYIKENILKRNFKSDKPYSIICTDITYLHYNNKECYLCGFIDARTSEIVGYKLSTSLTRDFVIECTKDVIKKAKKYNKSILIHSDRGSQYTSKEFKDLLCKMQVIQSMSSPGSPIDNAVIESFWGHLKDYVDLRNCTSFRQVIETIDKYMYYYNYNRPQWNKNKMTPVQFRQALLAA